jgi:plastocyanin
MSQRNRALAALGAVVVLVMAFVLLRPGDDNTTNNEAAATVAATTTTTPSASARTTSTAAPTPAARPRPKVTTVRAVGLKPVGGIKSIKVNKGDTVRFAVTSDQPANVHLHGYDVEKPVAPGKPARYVFKGHHRRHLRGRARGIGRAAHQAPGRYLSDPHRRASRSAWSRRPRRRCSGRAAAGGVLVSRLRIWVPWSS